MFVLCCVFSFFPSVSLWKHISTLALCITRSWSTWCWIKCMRELEDPEQCSPGIVTGWEFLAYVQKCVQLTDGYKTKFVYFLILDTKCHYVLVHCYRLKALTVDFGRRLFSLFRWAPCDPKLSLLVRLLLAVGENTICWFTVHTLTLSCQIAHIVGILGGFFSNLTLVLLLDRVWVEGRNFF